MIIVSGTQFHVYLLWGQRPFSISESTSRRFQPGEGPSRGFLRDYKPSDLLRMELFEALVVGRGSNIHNIISEQSLHC